MKESLGIYSGLLDVYANPHNSKDGSLSSSDLNLFGGMRHVSEGDFNYLSNISFSSFYPKI